jgi:hypothetical protein
LGQGHRYNAACSAALAAAGKREDAQHLPDKVRLMLRRQALGWLRADLALWAARRETTRPEASGQIAQTLHHWQLDADLAAVRDREALAQLPDEEREAFTSLWNEVAALLKKVEQKK